MSTDIERTEMGLRFVHELWANVIQVGLATWLLQQQLGTQKTYDLYADS